MVSRWVAVGLETAEAISFADDPSIGSPPPHVLPDDHRPLSILVGDVGLASPSLPSAPFNSRSWRRVNAPVPPIPLFLHMRGGGLEAAIGRGAEGLGDVWLEGGYVIVDGADEVTPDLAARINQRGA